MPNRLSIVIPLYNKAQHIERAVNSVLSQTICDFELIIVDDGSIDDSLMVARSFEIDHRVKVVEQINKGVSAARNTGVQHSSGKFICFLDADDEWYDNFIEVISDLIERYPDASLYTVGHHTFSESGKLLAPKVALPDGFTGYVANFSKVYSEGYGIINSSSVCISREFYDSVNGFPDGKKNGEDIYLWLRADLEGSIVSSTLRCCVNYRDASNRSVCTNMELPYHFEYFYPKLAKMNSGNKKSNLEKFLRKNAILQVLGAILSSQRKSAVNILMFIIRYDMLVSSMIIVILLVPKAFLRLLRHIKVNLAAM